MLRVWARCREVMPSLCMLAARQWAVHVQDIRVVWVQCEGALGLVV